MRIWLEPKEIPTKWYNIVPDLEFDLPPIMSTSGYPLSHHDLRQLAPSPIIDQELEKDQ